MIGLIAIVCGVFVGGPGAPASLRCEYLTNPVGIDVAHPRLSWIVNDPRRGAVQSAYRVVVASSREGANQGAGDVWDSGEVRSAANAHVEYAGPRLEAGRRVYWAVRTWDAEENASPWSESAEWGVGLLKAEDWGGAKWIGVEGGREPARPSHNGFHSAFAAKADETKWVTIDLGSEREIDGVRLWPARPFDWKADVPGLMFPVRYRVEVAGNEAFEGAKVAVDRTGEDQPNPGEAAVEAGFESVRGRWVRLTVTRLRERDAGHFAVALAEMEVLSGGKVVSRGAAVKSSDRVTTNDWSESRLADGVLKSQRGRQAVRGPAAMMRTEAELRGKPARAMLYATAQGVYELRINGERVGNQELAPEWTDYATRIQYQAYDVTGLVKGGANAIAATVADGWFAGKTGLFSNEMYGSQLALMACVRVEYPDGSVQVMTTGPEWRGTLEGPVRSADLLDGEKIDAGRAMPGWDRSGFAASGWNPVSVFDAPKTAIVAQPNEPIRVTSEMNPVAVNEPTPGVVVVDFGQNLPGWVRIATECPAGTEIRVTHGEVLNEDGTLYTANLRGAKQADAFICAGGKEEFEPRFTYHGFRYAQVTGLPARGSMTSIVARVFHSAPTEAGTFECSNPVLNRLMSNIRWTQAANMMSVPTDCPQRDERLGWMGDAHIFAQTGIFNLDMGAFFAKWCVDIRDAQGADGRYSDVSPNPVMKTNNFTSVPGWGDAGVSVPWRVYENYGDTRLLVEHFESARRWVDYIRANNPGLAWQKDRGNDYGDWLNGDTLRLEGFPSKGGEIPKEIFATACFEQSCRTVARMAAAIGKKDEAEQYAALADKIREVFRERYVGADGAMPGDTQAGYALALKLDLAPDHLRPAMVKRLLAAIDRYGGHLSTGFHSTTPMLDELVRGGHADVAYRLVTSTEFPSWGFMIEQGATSMWERWDGYVKGRKPSEFQDPGMNSFNHFAFGAVGEWMYRTILGLNPVEPGWRGFEVKPVPGGGLKWAKGGYRSMHGRIEVSWRLSRGRFLMDLTVPPGSWARVHVPTSDVASVMEGDGPAGGAAGVTAGGVSGGAAVFSVRAGTYRFSAEALD